MQIMKNISATLKCIIQGWCKVFTFYLNSGQIYKVLKVYLGHLCGIAAG